MMAYLFFYAARRRIHALLLERMAKITGLQQIYDLFFFYDSRNFCRMSELTDHLMTNHKCSRFEGT